MLSQELPGPLGKIKCRGGVGEWQPGNEHGLNCPNCRSMKIHPADGKIHSIEARP